MSYTFRKGLELIVPHCIDEGNEIFAARAGESADVAGVGRCTRPTIVDVTEQGPTALGALR